MAHGRAGREASPGEGAHRYERHRPEQTLLYPLVEQHYPAFVAAPAAEGREVPPYVAREFEDYLRCGRLEHGFLRVRCEVCHQERLVVFSCKRRAFCPSCGARRRVESAALLVDDILPEVPIRQWVVSFPYALRFRRVKAPERAELEALVQRLSERVGRHSTGSRSPPRGGCATS